MDGCPPWAGDGSLDDARCCVVSGTLAFFWQNSSPGIAVAKTVSAQEHSGQEHAVYRFAGCELDVRERRLQVHGQPVTLTPKVFDTLVLLVMRAGHVVSKDELMSALWPRGFVHESNLTKHIWLIRRALGDGEDEGRYIETVPKLGYRFVATVQRAPCEENANGIVPAAAVDDAHHASPVVAASTVDSSAPDSTWMAGRDPERRHGVDAEPVRTNKDLSTPVPPRRPAAWRRIAMIAASLGVIVVALAGVHWWQRSHAAVTSVPGAFDSDSVAIVDFNNLSGNAKDAWLGPALEQMLATEVAANGKLHAVPEELVRPARADLPAPDAGGYAPASLATLQRRLGARYVLSGAYLVSGTPDAPQLRVDLTVQDAHTGAMFASLSRSAAANDLPQVVAQVGGELRGRFGERSDPAMLKQIASAQPASTEVARHLGFALQALDQYDAARARDELLQAIAQAPGYAPAYLYLARAWSALGYRAKAIAASKQALQNADGLPQEERLQIEALRFTLQGNHAGAAQIWAKLVALHPQDPDFRLQLVDKLASAAKYDDAVAALAAARKLPGAADDPRYELAAAQIESARGNGAMLIPHARLALQQARERGETGLVAQAELQLGIALDVDQQAEPMLRKAAADFRVIGNPHGEALAWQNLGNLMDGRNQIAAAREDYQRAMTIYQGVGDLGGEAAVYDDLSRMLWNAGDRDGTEAALRQALAIGRETDDKVRQAWSLTGLATVMSDESAGDDVAAMYREAIELDRQSGDRGHLVFALSTYADLLRVRGELDAARDACNEAQKAALALAAPPRPSEADFECAQIALDRGEVNQAAAAFTRIERDAIAAKDGFDAANSQLVLGQIAMGRLRWADARDLLQRSRDGWAAAKETPGEATTNALLALCAAAQNDAAARDAALKRAGDLRSQVTARQEVLYLDIALAELQAQLGQPAQALAALRGYADDALKRHWVGYAFEARLAMLRVLEQGNDAAAATSARDALIADARKAGFGWVEQRVAKPQSHAPISKAQDAGGATREPRPTAKTPVFAYTWRSTDSSGTPS
jgi:DNA-binding winged helix-turn-helix (wHTH) protein/tetratricopeptide (TPR) repeat protein